MENFTNHIFSPFVHGINNIKTAVQEESANPKLELAERITRFALGILELIPVINYLVVAIDKYVIFRNIQIIPTSPSYLERGPPPNTPSSSLSETPASPKFSKLSNSSLSSLSLPLTTGEKEEEVHPTQGSDLIEDLSAHNQGSNELEPPPSSPSLSSENLRPIGFPQTPPPQASSVTEKKEESLSLQPPTPLTYLPFSELSANELKDEVVYQTPQLKTKTPVTTPSTKKVIEEEPLEKKRVETEVVSLPTEDDEIGLDQKPTSFLGRMTNVAWQVGKIALVALTIGVVAYSGTAYSQTPTQIDNQVVLQFSGNVGTSYREPPPFFIPPGQELGLFPDSDFPTEILDLITTNPFQESYETSVHKTLSKELTNAVKAQNPKRFLEKFHEIVTKLPPNTKSVRRVLSQAKKLAQQSDNQELIYLTRKAYRAYKSPQDLTSIDSYFLEGRPKDYQNPKIGLFTAYTTTGTPDRLEMSKKVAANQKGYSGQNGYTYIEYAENLAREIDPITGQEIVWEPYWSKIAAINNILNGKEASLASAEWIIWLDDDAVITNDSIRMEDVIEHYTALNPDLNFFVTTDSMSHIIRDIPLNSAVLFVKNNDWSRKFFAKVWEMRKTQIPGRPYTYGNCPNQSCLHEQQAITDLLTNDASMAKHARIIPQRDPTFPIGINTFVREDHVDLNRSNMRLMYAGDAKPTRGRAGDFIQQCTGLATRAYPIDKYGNPITDKIENLRLNCINKLLDA